MFTVWEVDCFFREFHTTPTCKHFTRFPSPGIFKIAWLSTDIAVSLFLIFHVCFRSPAFRGFLVSLRDLIRKKYFYKINLVLFFACIYDLVIIFDQPRVIKTISGLLFMMEKILVVFLVLLLNSLPRFWNDEDVKLKWWMYKIALVVYSLQSHLLALLGSTVAVYKVLTVSTPQTNDAGSSHAVKSVLDLMLLITNNGLKYFVGDFFLSKIFDENLDLLGGVKAQIKPPNGVPVVQQQAEMVPRRVVGANGQEA